MSYEKAKAEFTEIINDKELMSSLGISGMRNPGVEKTVYSAVLGLGGVFDLLPLPLKLVNIPYTGPRDYIPATTRGMGIRKGDIIVAPGSDKTTMFVSVTETDRTIVGKETHVATSGTYKTQGQARGTRSFSGKKSKYTPDKNVFIEDKRTKTFTNKNLSTPPRGLRMLNTFLKEIGFDFKKLPADAQAWYRQVGSGDYINLGKIGVPAEQATEEAVETSAGLKHPYLGVYRTLELMIVPIRPDGAQNLMDDYEDDPEQFEKDMRAELKAKGKLGGKHLKAAMSITLEVLDLISEGQGLREAIDQVSGAKKTTAEKTVAEDTGLVQPYLGVYKALKRLLRGAGADGAAELLNQHSDDPDGFRADFYGELRGTGIDSKQMGTALGIALDTLDNMDAGKKLLPAIKQVVAEEAEDIAVEDVVEIPDNTDGIVGSQVLKMLQDGSAEDVFDALTDDATYRRETRTDLKNMGATNPELAYSKVLAVFDAMVNKDLSAYEAIESVIKGGGIAEPKTLKEIVSDHAHNLMLGDNKDQTPEDINSSFDNAPNYPKAQRGKLAEAGIPPGDMDKAYNMLRNIFLLMTNKGMGFKAAVDAAFSGGYVASTAKEWRYGALNRPIGFATAPKGWIRIDSALPGNTKTRHGIAVYDRRLTDKEARRYELYPELSADDIIDPLIERLSLSRLQRLTDKMTERQLVSSLTTQYNRAYGFMVDGPIQFAKKNVSLLKQKALDKIKTLQAAESDKTTGGGVSLPPLKKQPVSEVAALNARLITSKIFAMGRDKWKDYLNTAEKDPALFSSIIEGMYYQDAVPGTFEKRGGSTIVEAVLEKLKYHAARREAEPAGHSRVRPTKDKDIEPVIKDVIIRAGLLLGGGSSAEEQLEEYDDAPADYERDQKEEFKEAAVSDRYASLAVDVLIELFEDMSNNGRTLGEAADSLKRKIPDDAYATMSDDDLKAMIADVQKEHAKLTELFWKIPREIRDSMEHAADIQKFMDTKHKYSSEYGNFSKTTYRAHLADVEKTMQALQLEVNNLDKNRDKVEHINGLRQAKAGDILVDEQKQLNGYEVHIRFVKDPEMRGIASPGAKLIGGSRTVNRVRWFIRPNTPKTATNRARMADNISLNWPDHDRDIANAKDLTLKKIQKTPVKTFDKYNKHMKATIPPGAIIWVATGRGVNNYYKNGGFLKAP